MPSLRRALSTPSVRASPYPSLLASRSQHPHPHGHRRPSGSHLSARKVLADIDWGRVAQGQGEQRGEEEDEEEGGGRGEDDEVTGETTSVSVMGAVSSDDPASTALPRASVAQLAAADHSENASVETGRPSTPDQGVRIFGYGYNSPQVI